MLRLFVLFVLACGASSPVFLWGGAGGALKKARQQTFVQLTSDQLLLSLGEIVSGSSRKGVVNDVLSGFLEPQADAPRCVVAFVKSTLSTAQFSRLAQVRADPPAHGGVLKYLKRAVQGADAHSLTAPYADVRSLVSSVAAPLAVQLKERGSIVHVGLPREYAAAFPGSPVALDAVLKYLRDRELPRMLVVYLHEDFVDDRQQDEMMEKITEAVAAKSGNSYLAVYAGDNPAGDDAMNPRQRHRARRSAQAGASPEPLASSYFPAGVWIWLIVSVLLLFLFLYAIFSIASVQVPPRLLDEEAARYKKKL